MEIDASRQGTPRPRPRRRSRYHPGGRLRPDRGGLGAEPRNVLAVGQADWITIQPSHYYNIIYAYYHAGTVSALVGAGGTMFTNLAMLSLAVLSTSTPRDPSFYRPRVELWTNRGDGAVYTRGERV